MKWENRPYDIFLEESYLDLKSRKIDIKERQTPEMQGVSRRVIKCLKEKSVTVEEALTDVLNELNISRTKEMEEALLGIIERDVILYVKAEAVSKLVKSLLKRGHCVAVRGNNWSVFAKHCVGEEAKNLVILDSDDNTKEILRKSKCYLEIEPQRMDELSPGIERAVKQGCYIITGGGKSRLCGDKTIKGISIIGQKHKEIFRFLDKNIKQKNEKTQRVIKKILITDGTNQYGVLSGFADELEKEWLSMGIRVERINPGINLSDFRYDDVDLFFSFNAMTMIDYKKQEAILKKNALVWSFLVDHPMWLDERIAWPCRGRVVSCVDKEHAQYARRYYPNNAYNCFAPHGGHALPSLVKWEDKKYDVVCLGTYMAPETFLYSLSKEEESIQEMLIEMIAQLYADPMLTIESALEQQLEKRDSTLDTISFRSYLTTIAYIDKYIRSKRRYDAINELLKNGIKVDVFGNGWENFDTEYRENLFVHENLEFEKAIQTMSESKIVLNVMPAFTDGSHERVFTTMGTGAICVSDKSKFLEETFEDEKEIFFYSINDLSGLSIIVNKILNKEYNVEQVIEAAYNKVINAHLWKHRARAIIEVAEKIVFENQK